MGEISFAALCSHVPPLVAPPGLHEFLSPDHPTTLIDGLHSMRATIDASDTDTFFIIDTHWVTTSHHILDGAAHHKGVFTSDEVPAIIQDVEYDYPGAPELGDLIVEAAEHDGLGDRVNNYGGTLAKHYGTLNLLRFLHSDQRVLSVGCCQNAEPHNFLQFGKWLGKAIQNYDGNVGILASGGMSHKFHEFDVVFEPQNRTYAPSGVKSDRHRDLDLQIIELWKRGKHEQVLDLLPELASNSPEGWFAHYLVMLGALGGAGCTEAGEPFSEYENQIGTGQYHMVFVR